MKQYSRSEIKGNHINRLQERYNNLYKSNKELENKYEELSHFAIEVAFSDMNDDVELLLRCLKRQGLIKLYENEYINSLNDENYLKTRELGGLNNE